MQKKLLGIEIKEEGKKDVLEQIKKNIKTRKNFFHITSLNPENLVIAHEAESFKEVIAKSQIKITDGTGLILAARLLHIPIGPRITGVDLMSELLCMADEERSTVMLLGAGPKIAERVAECQKEIYPRIDFYSLEGISDIKNPTKLEEDRIFSIVATRKPHFLFVAFGSPDQELWIYKNRHKLTGVVCMGVGGGFDFLSGTVARAPKPMRDMGVEWLFRLIRQPWRLKRQLRLIRFALLVLRQKISYS